jgi:hypothetical protein
MKRIKLKHLILLGCILIFQTPLFALEDAKQSAEPSFDIKLLAAICAAAGTLTTAIVNLIRWIRERSAVARKSESISHALKLRDFINAETDLGSAINQGTQSQTATAAAREELRILLSKLSGIPREISRLRKTLLLYSPKGWRAWIAHSLFFTICIFSVAFAVAGATGQLEDFTTAEFVLLFTSFILYGTLSQRWANLEYRLSNCIQLQPKLWGCFCWYPANNRFGFLAQILIVIGFLRLLFLFSFFLPATSLFASVPFSRWEFPIAMIVRSAFIPIGYFWSQTEFKYLNDPNCRPNWRVFIRALFRFNRGEQIVGVIALIALTIWNLILIADFKSISLAASFPDSEGVPVGIPSVLFSYLLSAAMIGLLPWLAVWRGIPRLYGNGRQGGE